MEFSFPLNFEDENLTGKLRWKAEGAPSSLLWISFTLKNKKISVKEVDQYSKLQMKDSLPLHFTLPNVLSRYAGSGNLTLVLDKGQLQQEVKLVVMRGEELGRAAEERGRRWRGEAQQDRPGGPTELIQGLLVSN